MTTTPTPWTALPAPAALGHPDGTWLVVGPRTDGGEPHTIAVCVPCDDGTHPDRAQADAQLIERRANGAFALLDEQSANPRRDLGAAVRRQFRIHGGVSPDAVADAVADVLAPVVARIHQRLEVTDA